MSLLGLFKRGRDSEEGHFAPQPHSGCVGQYACGEDTVREDLSETMLAMKLEVEREQAEFDRLLGILNGANESASSGGDIEVAIRDMEYVLKNESSGCWSYAWHKRLISLYLKSGMNDRAWGHLNWLAARRPDCIEHIEHDRCSILKKEKRYVDAMNCLMSEHLQRSRRVGSFESGKFEKDARPIANKMGWGDREVGYLSYLIGESFGRGDADNSNIRKMYRAFLSDIGLAD